MLRDSVASASAPHRVPLVRRSLSRRRLLALIGAGGVGAALSACTGSPAPPTPAPISSPAAAAPTTAPPAGPSPAAASPVAASPTASPAPAASPVAAASPSPSPSPSPAASPSPVGSPAASAGAPSLFVKPVPEALFITHGSNQEMRWENMQREGYTTPNALFFIRNHSRTAIIDPATWRLRVEGDAVERTLDLTLNDIMAMPSVTITRFIECTGNGRSFFDTIGGQQAQGTQWKLGAVGVAEWKGVPVREVLNRAGVKPGARDVLAEGLDELKVRRPVSLEKAMADDTILAFQMNGEPLPPDHGGPVRFLVPFYTGISSIKWLGRLEVSTEAIYTPWNTTSYILEGPNYQPQPPARGPVITFDNLKSALELPWPAQLRAGRQTIRGRSWTGQGQVAKVEYSLDEGRTWQTAQLQEPNTAGAWVRWQFEWQPTPGAYTIRVRATDNQGNTQPETVPFNTQGYLYNGIVPHPVTVT